MLMMLDFDELCVCVKEINMLKPNLDPLTIITNIINNEDDEDCSEDNIIIRNNDIIRSSNLNSMGIINFRHQHILIILIIMVVLIKVIHEFSTSKVDILFKLFRTFVDIRIFVRFFICCYDTTYFYSNGINLYYFDLFVYYIYAYGGLLI